MRNSIANANIVYAFGDSVALARRHDARTDVVLWDPPSLADYWFRPLRDNMHGSPSPYVLAAATLTAQLSNGDKVRAAVIDELQTGAFSAWRGGDGRIRLLFGNLEEGLRHDQDQSRTLHIRLPASLPSSKWTDAWSGESRQATERAITVRLPPYGSRLLVSDH